MSPTWVPSEPIRSAWHRRFPDRRPLWTGCLRLWRVELAVRPIDSLLSNWVERSDGDAAPRLGLPEAIIAAIRSGEPVERKWFAFLELPGGLHAIPTPTDHFDDWPEPITSVPAGVLKPAATDVFSFAGQWRAVPLVRAEVVRAMAIRSGNGIEVYVADETGTLSEMPLAILPGDAITAESGDRG
jgi:hypothetical protein